MIFDSEDLLDSVLSVMTSGSALNAAISALEADKSTQGKGLTPTLAGVDASAYFVQTWDNKILNQKGPSIFFGIEDVQVSENAGAVAKTYQVFVEVVLVDDLTSPDGYKRIMRYSRALEELFKNKFAPAISMGSVKIQSVRPISFKLELDSSDEVKVGGISLTIVLV